MSEFLTEHHPEPNLRDLLVIRARSASDGRLVSDVIGGALAASLVLFWQPAGWLPLLSGACCFVTFGTWGITDRVLRERAPTEPAPRALTVIRALAAILGAVSGAGLLLGLSVLALGTWTS